MPVPKPHKGEKEQDFVSRCITQVMNDGTTDDNKQAAAICYDAWRQAHGGKKPKKIGTKQLDVPDPDPDESKTEFMDRCVGELQDQDEDLADSDAEEACQTAWEERITPPVMHKLHSDDVSKNLEFVLSDATADRYGDIIAVDGWKLANFRRNPIALFSHNPQFIVGRWRDLRVEQSALRGFLELAPEGTSDRIDEIRRLVQAGILKAVSVGFKPLKHEPIDEKDPWGGTRFLEAELVETSLVAVPANANALAIAKSLNISRDTMDFVFAEPGKRSEETRSREYHAEHGRSQHGNGKGKAMTPFAQRIQELEARIVGWKDELEAHWATADNTDISDADIEKANNLTAKIVSGEKQRESLIASEKLLAGSTTNGNGHDQQRSLTVYHAPANGGRTTEGETTTAAPAIIRERMKTANPVDYLVRAATVAYAAKSWGKSQEEARAMIARDFPVYDDDGTKGMCEFVLRAATAPAMTTVTGWAAELVQQTYADPMGLLMPNSILNRLRPRGLSLTFGRAGKINIPTRSRTPTIAGSFVGEGQPIPVRMGAFTSQSLTPKKLAVITTFTREMGLYSTPAIEGVLREAIQDDTTVAVDSVLIDANPATTVRPAGLLNGVAALTATAGGGFAAFVGDLKQVSGALIASTLGNIRAPTWLMNPGDINSGKFIVAPASGEFPWRDELAAGTLNGWPVIDSGTVPLHTMVAVDAADFVTTGGDGPRFDVSDVATLHEEDTNPQPLAAAGTPAVVAAPMRSLFQTDSIGLRMIQELNWLMRRTGMVAWVQNVTW